MKSALATLLLLIASVAAQANAPLLFIPANNTSPGPPPYFRIHVLNPLTGEIETRINSDSTIWFTAVDHASNRVIASAGLQGIGTSQLLVLDANTGTLLETVDRDHPSSPMQVDPTAGELYVGAPNPPAVHVLDLATFEQLRTLNLDGSILRRMALYPDGNAIISHLSMSGDRRLVMQDVQTGEQIASEPLLYWANAWAMDRQGSRLLLTDDDILHVLEISPEGFGDEFITGFPFGIEELLVDADRNQLFVAWEEGLYRVNLAALYDIQPGQVDQINPDSVDFLAGGPMDIGRPDDRLYVVQRYHEFPVPPGGSAPSGSPDDAPQGFSLAVTAVHPETMATEAVGEIPVLGYIPSEGPIAAGEALPNAPAIPTLGPAGIGVLIVLMAGMAVRRYRLRARFHSSMPPS